jgi:hypothetical protein
VNDFDKPVTVSISYDRADVANVDLNTLAIHHYDPRFERWNILTDCQNNYDPRTGLGEISCQTNSFSIFGLFAESTPAIMSSGRNSSTVVGSKNNIALVSDLSNLPNYTGTPQNQTQEEIQNISTQEDQDLRFPNNLWIGSFTSDVVQLQRFLNEQGFTIATQGPGSPGQETPYFGERTLQALKKFQTYYAESILKPAGLSQATGYFGIFTRMFVNQNF